MYSKNRQRRSSLVLVFLLGAILVIMVIVIGLGSGGGGIPTSGSESDLFPPGVEGQLSPEQQKAYERLTSNSRVAPWLRVENGVIRYTKIAVAIPDSRANTTEAKAKSFLQDYSDLFNISEPSTNLIMEAEVTNSNGDKQITFLQSIAGIPVYGSMLRVHINSAGEVTQVNGAYLPGTVSSATPKISETEAERIAIQNLNISDQIPPLSSTLIFLDDAIFSQGDSDPKLVWDIEITFLEGPTIWTVFVDATTGEVVRLSSNISEFTVAVFNNHQVSYEDTSNATQVMDNDGCRPNTQCDDDAKYVYQYSKEYGDFLFEKFKRDGYDGKGSVIKSYMHVSSDPISFNWWCPSGGPSAFWWGTTQSTYYTDGMSQSSGIVAHELTHATIDYLIPKSPKCIGFCYEKQSGALDESYGDVFGVLLDNGNPSQNWRSSDWRISDWKIGEGTSIVKDLSNPQIDHMDEYKDVPLPTCYSDYGYVHDNSGIPTKAAYLLLQDSEKEFHSIKVRGIGPQKVAKIYYETLQTQLTSNATFRDARDGTVLACMKLIGKEDRITLDDCNQVVNAFAAVGISGRYYIPSPPTPGQSTLNPTAVTIDTPSPVAIPVSSSNILLFDVSGSMGEQDATGIAKIDAAKNSGSQILDIIQAENSVSQGAEVGILSFSNGAWVNAFLSSDVASARSALNGLYPLAGTGMPDGLRLAIDQLAGVQNAKPIIIMLSDGLPNIPLASSGWFGDPNLPRQQSLDLALEAGTKGICIFTVGFGIPNTMGGISGEASIDEDFLKQVSANSGCGVYYNAQNATQLANVYVSLRHLSTGNILLNQTGNISQGQTVDIANVQVPDNQSMILFTLNWPGSQLDAVLTDPSGATVDSNYLSASFSTADTLASVIIQNPQPGDWKVAAKGVDVPEGMTTYNAVLSARPNPNPPTEVPQEAPPATVPTAPGFPVVILLLVVAGGGIAVYVLMQTRAKSRSKTLVGAMAAQLVCITGELVGRVLPLKDGLLVGRGSGSTLKLKDRVVSRRHMKFRFAGGQWFIQDLNSQSGTFVNDVKVKATVLNNGDRIRIGSTIFEFRTTR